MKDSSQIGKVLDNYRIVDTLGEGGMGVVYKAVHTKLDKIVALKMIASGLSMNTKFIIRFQTEAKALAKLQDPNIVAIHDLRSHENQWFIAMEYVDGEDLYDIVAKEGAYKWRESIAIAKQILSAVGHAHKAGIIHRDLKPHNIMITDENMVKITDFGLAKDEANHLHTMTIASGGSLNYMSPEHVRGFSYIEKRSDIYCVGIILYEMVTGEVPFKNLDSDFDIRESILRKDFDTPTTINAKIPSDLESIIMKSIEKNPEDRFQSAEEMLEALEDFEKGKKVTYKRKRRSKTSKSISAKIIFPFAFLFLLVFTGYYFDYFTPNTAEEITKVPIKSNLSINSNPGDVNVYLNNESLGQTPLDKYEVKSGNYSVKLEKDNFNTMDTSVTVEEGINLTLNLNLSPVEKIVKKENEAPLKKSSVAKTTEKSSFASLLLNSIPSGATVYINNKNKGVTPLRLNELNSGNYEIKVTQSGYRDYVKNMQLESEENQKITANLLQNAGSLTINTVPDNVTLSIDGEITQIKNGIARMSDVAIGKRKIKISKTGYSEFNKEIEIKQNQEATINATLSQLMGKLIVKIRPWGKVYINNQLQENATDTKYENELAVDSYNLKVEHPTLGFWQKDINIINGNHTEIKVNFTKKIPITISAFGENGEPFAGNIMIDGKFSGKTTPQEIKVPVGFHKILVEKPGFKAVKGQREFLIEENSNESIVFILKENGNAN
jgi:eukaryotic-like serine/threonine-protein kinase